MACSAPERGVTGGTDELRLADDESLDLERVPAAAAAPALNDDDDDDDATVPAFACAVTVGAGSFTSRSAILP